MMEEVELVNALMKLSLFEGLDFNQISNIHQACNQRNVEPGTVLCEPLTIDERLLIFVDGKLRLESAGATFNRCGKREKATLTFHYTVPTKTAR